MLRTRIITALVALPIVIGAVFAGKLWFLAGIGLIGLIAGWEFDQMMKAGGYRPTSIFTLGLRPFQFKSPYQILKKCLDAIPSSPRIVFRLRSAISLS